MADIVIPTSYKQFHYKGLLISSIAAPGADGIQVKKPDTEAFIEDCILDFRNIPKQVQDEVVSSVEGPKVHMKRCVILGGIKALLCGNGDHPAQDAATCQWDLEDCILIGSGRRCPEAQHGTKVTMSRCWICDWGLAFDVRAFGSWAHSGGSIIADYCAYSRTHQKLGFVDRIKDSWHHFWQSLHDNGILALFKSQTYVPGIWRGLTADSNGYVEGNHCYRSNKKIRMTNCKNFLTEEEGDTLVKSIISKCPNVKERLGVDLLEIWEDRM